MPPPDAAGGRPFGLNVLGNLASEKGVGEAVRAAVRAARAAGIPVALHDLPDPGAGNAVPDLRPGAGGFPYAVNLFSVNPDALPWLSRGLDLRAATAGRYTVGYWFWELPEFPAAWADRFALVDEVWVGSRYTQGAIARASTVPVVRVPPALDLAPEVGRLDRAALGLPPDAYVFLFVFDAASHLARKNPAGLVRAFRDAFPSETDVRLVLKSSRLDQAPAADRDELLRAAQGDGRVLTLGGLLPRPEVTALLGLADCYVSLHRSEGFGLTMAEAMALGKPVVATGYSGNLDFMTPRNSLLVDARPVVLDRDHGPYRAGQTWAEPDLGHAARQMRWAYRNRAAAADLGRRGRAEVAAQLDPAAVGAMIADRLGVLRQLGRLTVVASPDSDAPNSSASGGRDEVVTRPPLRVLFVVHGHPSERPGGAEVYATELDRAAQHDPRIEPFLLTRTARRGTPPVWADPADPRHFWLSTHDDDFDFLYQEYRPLGTVGVWLDRLLRDTAPEVVHFQHTLFVGLDLVRRVRAVLPGVRVVYTLHEFFPICYHRGLMFRTQERVPCDRATPARCHECFPDVSAASFAARAGHVQRRLAGVDLFVAPSRFLRDRYVEWGLPADRVVVEEYGRLPTQTPADPPPTGDPRRARFGYFGQLNAFKGVDVLLRAVLHLAASPGGLPAGFELHLHGANLELQPAEFRTLYRGLLDACRPLGVVTDRGPYTQEQSAGLMAGVDWVVVPSVWWENSPLVIQEAFAHGRPVIGSDIGGVREKVADGTDGLHFRAADPADLARVLAAAATTPGLWDELHANVRPPYPMADHLHRLLELYRTPQTRPPLGVTPSQR